MRIHNYIKCNQTDKISYPTVYRKNSKFYQNLLKSKGYSSNYYDDFLALFTDSLSALPEKNLAFVVIIFLFCVSSDVSKKDVSGVEQSACHFAKRGEIFCSKEGSHQTPSFKSFAWSRILTIYPTMCQKELIIRFLCCNQESESH